MQNNNLIVFEALMAAEREKLISSLCKMLTPAEAEEVYQESCIRLYQCLSSVSEDAIKPYFYKIARNLALSYLRHQTVVRNSQDKLQLYQDVTQQIVGLEDAFIEKREQALLLQAINAMPPVCRQVFIFRKIDGLSQSEIAEKMAISVNTVQNHITKGMKFCREYILEHGNEPINRVQSVEQGLG